MANITARRSLNEIQEYEVDSHPAAGGGTSGAVGTLAMLNTGVQVRIFVKTGSDNTSWLELAASVLSAPMDNYAWRRYEFLNSNGFAVVTNGVGASGQISTFGLDATERVIGAFEIDTGTNNSGRATFWNNNASAILFGYARHYLTIRGAVQILSDAAQRFIAAFGFINVSAAGNSTNGAYFRYTDNVNSGAWVCVTVSGGTETATNTTSTADTLYHTFAIEVNEAGTSVDFKIDGVVVATNTTNIPTA